MFRTALCVPSACSSTSLRLYSFHDIQKYSGYSQGSQHLTWSRTLAQTFSLAKRHTPPFKRLHDGLRSVRAATVRTCELHTLRSSGSASDHFSGWGSYCGINTMGRPAESSSSCFQVPILVRGAILGQQRADTGYDTYSSPCLYPLSGLCRDIHIVYDMINRTLSESHAKLPTSGETLPVHPSPNVLVIELLTLTRVNKRMVTARLSLL
jgi:hypothetical protein